MSSINASFSSSKAASSLSRYWTPWTQVILLLLLATLLDKVTGPFVSAAAFYIFPIGLAGWRIRGKAAGLIVAAAVVLNAITIWLDTKTFTFDLVASQALEAFVYGAVAFLATHLRSKHLLLKEQKERLDRLNRQMTDEMRAARKLQELLFVPPPVHPAIEIGIFMAAARILGGDALDVSFSGNLLALLVADVSGKGSPAALATAVLKGMLEECPMRFTSPARTLEFLNGRLDDHLPDNMFVTAFYLLMNLETGEATWASAGHEPPLLTGADPAAPLPQKAQEILGADGTSSNVPLAVLGNTVYDEHRLCLGRGMVLFCYTDGLTDLRLPSGERLGRENLKTLFAKYADLPCADINEAMLRDAMGQSKEHFMSGILDDDLSSIALRRRGTRANSASVPP